MSTSGLEATEEKKFACVANVGGDAKRQKASKSVSVVRALPTATATIDISAAVASKLV